MADRQFTPPRLGARTRRIAPASPGVKASGLATGRVERTAWCRPSPRRRQSPINHLAVACCAVVGALSFGAAAAAAPAYGPPAGWPDLAPMALAKTDFPGARVSSQGYVKPDSDSLAEYDRSLVGARVAGKRVYFLENDLDVFKRVDDADLIVDSLALGLEIYAKRIGAEFAKETGLKVTYTKVGRPQGLGVGNNSVGVVVHIGTRAGEIRLIFAVIRLGSLDSIIDFAGFPRAQLGIVHAKQLAQISVRRIRAALVPQSTAAPAISGTVVLGQTLSVSTGTWLNFPVTYAYQWERCDAAGANCAAIPGATAQTYAITPNDVGFTLAAVVGATNVYGSGSATSAPTIVVPPEPPPPT
jgi:hypothetical protein